MYNLENNFQYFENNQNLIYFSVNKVDYSKRRGKKLNKNQIVNVAIFNTTTGESKKLFTNDLEDESITDFVFESHHDPTKNEIILENKGYRVKNNKQIEARPMVDRILLEITDLQSKQVRLLCCNKLGENLEQISEIWPEGTWFLDIYNRKIRVLQQKAIAKGIKSYDW